MNTDHLQAEAPGALHVDRFATSEMWHKWRDHFSHPPLFNDLGCFRTGPDVMGIHNFMFPPFSGNGEGTAFLYIDRKQLASHDEAVGFTWYPDRVRRRATFQGFSIETITRAAVDCPAALIELTLQNVSGERRTSEVAVKLAGRLLHTIDGWASIGPAIGVEDEHKEEWCYDPASGIMFFTSAPNAFTAQGTLPRPDRVEGKALLYNVSLAPGEEWKLKFAAVLDEDSGNGAGRCLELLRDFDEESARVTAQWNEKITSAFTPGNSVFSGHLPTLVTDNEDLLRLYQVATIGCICLRRDNPISKYGPAYATLSPNYWTTASFLWDMMIAAPFYALLDPDLLRNHIEVWLQADITKCLATDYVTGKSLGYWYAVNSSAIVRLAHDYLRYTGDFVWLDREIAGTKVIDHLQKHALEWHDYDKHGHGLADCGGVLNLLECVTTYTHEVAAFNAMWVAALRQVAAMRRLRGEGEIAQKLEADAAGLLENVLTLYAEGEGYWRCRQPDGTYHDVHHIYDFVAVLESIADDLPPNVREEMYQNFVREHQTDNWTRSLYDWDDDAHRSLRVDHQWTGSYVSISAQAMNGLYRIGRGAEAFDWLGRVSKIVRQGPIGQAHWVSPLFPAFEGGAWKCTYTSPFICDWLVSANGVYPSMIIESVFGVSATLDAGLKWRGATAALDPEARLENLAYQGKSYTVDRTGIRMAGSE
jgi:hypothetical protein